MCRYAALGNVEALCKLIIDLEADVNLPMKDGTTPAHCAADNGHEGTYGIIHNTITIEIKGSAVFLQWSSVKLVFLSGSDFVFSNTFQRSFICVSPHKLWIYDIKRRCHLRVKGFIYFYYFSFQIVYVCC